MVGVPESAGTEQDSICHCAGWKPQDRSWAPEGAFLHGASSSTGGGSQWETVGLLGTRRGEV